MSTFNYVFLQLFKKLKIIWINLMLLRKKHIKVIFREYPSHIVTFFDDVYFKISLLTYIGRINAVVW